jgi:hypothetical protein
MWLNFWRNPLRPGCAYCLVAQVDVEWLWQRRLAHINMRPSGVAAAMHVTLVGGSADHGPIDRGGARLIQGYATHTQ